MFHRDNSVKKYTFEELLAIYKWELEKLGFSKTDEVGARDDDDYLFEEGIGETYSEILAIKELAYNNIDKKKRVENENTLRLISNTFKNVDDLQTSREMAYVSSHEGKSAWDSRQYGVAITQHNILLACSLEINLLELAQRKDKCSLGVDYNRFYNPRHSQISYPNLTLNGYLSFEAWLKENPTFVKRRRVVAVAKNLLGNSIENNARRGRAGLLDYMSVVLDTRVDYSKYNVNVDYIVDSLIENQQYVSSIVENRFTVLDKIDKSMIGQETITLKYRSPETEEYLSKGIKWAAYVIDEIEDSELLDYIKEMDHVSKTLATLYLCVLFALEKPLNRCNLEQMMNIADQSDVNTDITNISKYVNHYALFQPSKLVYIDKNTIKYIYVNAPDYSEVIKELSFYRSTSKLVNIFENIHNNKDIERFNKLVVFSREDKIVDFQDRDLLDLYNLASLEELGVPFNEFKESVLNDTKKSNNLASKLKLKKSLPKLYYHSSSEFNEDILCDKMTNIEYDAYKTLKTMYKHKRLYNIFSKTREERIKISKQKIIDKLENDRINEMGIADKLRNENQLEW